MPDDYTLLDRPEVTRTLFYPRPARSAAPGGARDLMVQVTAGTAVHCRWHPSEAGERAILFFHGNGEIVADYDDLAPIYRQWGFSLFVADFRGYGMSDGRPTFSAMLADSLPICAAFHQAADDADVGAMRVIMGRSLGALPAVYLAAARPERFRGIVLESGAAGVRGWSRFARPEDDSAAWHALGEAWLATVRAVRLPLLTIHGALDSLIPLESALAVGDVIGSTDQEIEIIPDAGHNDLLANSADRYFGALRRFADRLDGSEAAPRRDQWFRPTA